MLNCKFFEEGNEEKIYANDSRPENLVVIAININTNCTLRHASLVFQKARGKKTLLASIIAKSITQVPITFYDAANCQLKSEFQHFDIN